MNSIDKPSEFAMRILCMLSNKQVDLIGLSCHIRKGTTHIYDNSGTGIVTDIIKTEVNTT